MKRNVILPLVAVGIAPAAYAAEVPVSVDTKIQLVSADGTPATTRVTVLPGNYSIKIGAESTTGTVLKVDGQEVSTLKVTEEKTVTIEASSTAGTAFKVNVDFNLDYDFDAAADALTTELSKVITLINKVENAEIKKSLTAESSAIATKIQDVKKDGTYAKYKAYELYKGVENCTIIPEIKALETKVLNAGNSTEAYNKAVAAIAELRTTLQTANTKLGAATKYAKDKYTGTFKAIEKEVTDFEAQAKEADNKGTAAIVCTDEAIKSLKEKVTKEIDDLIKNIDKADANDKAYNAVAPLVDEAKKAYDATVQALIADLGADEVYKNMNTAAQKELNVQFKAIMDVATNNGTAEAHDKAAETEAANKTALEAAKAEIAKIQTKYQEEATKLRAAYKTACDKVTELSDNLKAAYGGDDRVKKDFATEIANIEAQINAIKTAVDNANEAHTIDKYVINSAEIEKATAELKTKAAAKTTNYAANDATVKKIGEVQTAFDKAKEAVDALVSKDGAYKAAGRYAATEKAITDAIAKWTADAKAAFDKGEASKFTADYATTENAIKTYQSGAESVVAKYDKLKTDQANVSKALDELKKVVKNGNVTTPEGKTYQQEMDAIQKALDDCNKSIAAANAKTDAEHVKAFTDITFDASLAKEATDLKNSYADNESTFDKNALDNTKTLMLKQAETNISETQGEINDITKDAETRYGKSKDEILNKAKAIQDVINAETTKVDDAKKSTDVLAAIALLTEVNESLAGLEEQKAALKKAADEAAAKVAANNAQLEAANNAVAAINVLIDGNGKTGKDEIKGIAAINEDPNKRADFSKSISELTAALDGIKNKIGESYKNETLVKDYADGAEGAKGYGTQLEELKTKVNAERDKAVAATANWNAYTALNKYITDKKFDDAIKAAKDGVAKVTKDAGLTYFNETVIAGCEAALGKINDDIDKNYKDNKAVSETNGIKLRADNLLNDIKAVAGLAEKNQKQYDALTKAITDVEKKWSDAYYKLSTEDQSSTLIYYQEQLADLQSDINKLKDNVKKDFGTGKCDTNGVTLNAEAERISNAINGIVEAQQEGYDAAIAKDNDQRYADFLDAADAAENAYKKAIQTSETLLNVKNEEFRTDLDKALETNKEIYAYADLIRKLRADAKAAKEGTTSPNLFDEDETFKEQANTYTQDINDKINNFAKVVNEEAKQIWTPKKEAIQDELDAAVTTLKSNNVTTEAVQKRAFNDVRTLIENVTRAESSNEFAATLDNYYAELAIDNINKLLDAGYEPAAVDEWNTQLKEVQDQMAKITGLGTVGGTDYKKLYDDNVAASVTKAEEIANAAIANNKLYGDELGKALTELGNFKGKEIADKYKAAFAADKVNKDAYAALMVEVNNLYAEYDKAAKFADGYVADCSGTLSGVKKQIDAFKDEVDGAYEKSQAEAQKDGLIKNNKEKLLDAINATYPLINSAEQSELERQVKTLKADYNKGVEALGLGNTDLQKFDGTIKTLENKVSNPNLLWEVNAKGERTKLKANDVIQPELVAIEAEMSEVRNGIAALIDNKTTNDAIASVDGALETLNANYGEAVEEAAYNEAIGKVYDSQLNDVKAIIDDVTAEIDKAKADGNILFYNEKLVRKVDEAAKELKTVREDNGLDAMYNKYVDNDKAFETLTAELNKLTADLESTKAIVTDFNNEALKLETYKTVIENIEKLITADTKTLKESHDNIELTKSSAIEDEREISELITGLQKTVNSAKQDIQIGDLTKAVQAIEASINGSDIKISDADKKAVKDEIEKINASIGALSNYKKGAVENSVITKDIDGNDLKDKDGKVIETLSIDYLTEAVSAIDAKIAEINGKIAALSAEAESKVYILGDINNDGDVDAVDLITIRQIITELTDAPEAGTREFNAADANADGKISVTDVTSITNTILNAQNTEAAKKTRAKSPAADASNDAISLSSEGEGVSQRIAVNLTNAVGYVACQMDIALPSGITLMGESLGERANSHELLSNNVSNGAHRVLITSMENATFNGNNGALLYLDVNVSPLYKGEGITISNVEFTDGNANAYALGGGTDGTTGIGKVGVTEYVGSKIYSIGGHLRDAVKKGINIIRNADGSAKKVMKK